MERAGKRKEIQVGGTVPLPEQRQSLLVRNAGKLRGAFEDDLRLGQSDPGMPDPVFPVSGTVRNAYRFSRASAKAAGKHRQNDRRTDFTPCFG